MSVSSIRLMLQDQQNVSFRHRTIIIKIPCPQINKICESLLFDMHVGFNMLVSLVSSKPTKPKFADKPSNRCSVYFNGFRAILYQKIFHHFHFFVHFSYKNHTHYPISQFNKNKFIDFHKNVHMQRKEPEKPYA